jgi:hypothetical protein
MNPTAFGLVGFSNSNFHNAFSAFKPAEVRAGLKAENAL